MNNAPQLARAVLIPMNGDQPETDESKHILVQFNPETLKVTLANTLKADTKGGNTDSAAQFVDKSDSSLAVDLLFDTTVARDADSSIGNADTLKNANTHEANSDVRALTKKIADAFMQPQNPESDRPGAPQRCRFQWGAFVFVGMLGSYNETLDYFSPEGIPLRAKLSLSFKESRYQFEQLAVSAERGKQPSFTPASRNLPETLANKNKDPKKWRDTALFNGIENPRLGLSMGVSVPGVDIRASAGISGSAPDGIQHGFSAGVSASLGTSIPGAFVALKAPSMNTSTRENPVTTSSPSGGSSISSPQLDIKIRR